MKRLSKRLISLFEGYINNTLSDSEKAAFFETLRSESRQEDVRALIDLEIKKLDLGEVEIDRFLSEENAGGILQRVLQDGADRSKDNLFKPYLSNVTGDAAAPDIATASVSLKKERRVKRLAILRWAVAASVLVLLCAGLYWGIAGKQDEKKTLAATAPQEQYDVLPGRNSAMIILSDGSRINLDSAMDGKIGQEENTRVVKQNGQLSYKSVGLNRKTLYNTITTARGNQYSLVLPDGTRVWLNAESSITFPTAFIENERSVKISGEAYLEVAKIKNRPFKAFFSDGAEIEVLGTHFNINSYHDEPAARATLLEGKIRVRNARETRLLEPGQQAYIKNNHPMEIIRNADVEAAVAWKNGFFSFRNADIQTIMLHLARWYDLDVSYKGAPRNEKFSGEIDRSLTLASVLAILDKTKVRFRIEKENKLIILP